MQPNQTDAAACQAPPTLHDLVTGDAPAAPGEAYSQASAAWKARRVLAYQAVCRTIGPDQQALLNTLLEVHGHECALRGAAMGAQAARREARIRNGEQSRAQAEAAAQARRDNRQINDLLKRAADENAALRRRADTAEKDLAALRATLPGIERVIRQDIIAAAPADHRPIARLAPRSGVHYTYLSHGFHVRRIARRIEEFMAGPDCRGYARPEKLAEFLLPETPYPTFQQAITHLLLCRRIIQSPSGAYRLRNPSGAPR
ncbi:deoxyribose-phosphate aldolase, deoC [Deinococcus grandis]|uniref:Deoxyribose-phosphate aldolase, deoC n=1 Tax=Deinococcus grandis TaxID=57498 RepID=A0A117DS98_9DEIO|nr:hypothetical protein [Deinococcus grandis]GAQ23985.1 deoxyribose-phosphate aldolase, deoC [Deinococcus grandis]